MSDSVSPSARENRRIARAAGVVSSATALSRVLGLARDVVFAACFGAGGGLDAFFVAFRLPNTLRRLFAEGSLTVAFVPVFVDALESEGERRARLLGCRMLTLLGLVLAAVSAAGVLGAPVLVRATAWGFARDPHKFALTVDLTRWVFPYIGLIGLTALAGGMLNAWGVFGPPALAPVLLNVFLIGAALGLSPWTDPPVLGLAAGVLLGGTAQLALQAWGLRGVGFRYRPALDVSDPYIRRILRLMGPAVFGVAVYQVNILVSTFLASWLPDGSVSYLYYAERLFQLPLGVFAVALGTASLPSLSRLASRGDRDAFRSTLADSLALTAFVVVPAAVGLWVLGRPIVGALFERGAFTPVMADRTASALAAYAAALVPVAGVRVLAPAFYALGDTRTPVRAAWWAFWVNVGASLALMGPLSHVGLALATAVSSAFNLGYLVRHLGGRIGGIGLATQRGRYVRMAAAAAVMGLGVRALGGYVPPHGGWVGVLGVLGVVALGAVAYLGAARLLGVPEAGRVVAVVRGRILG